MNGDDVGLEKYSWLRAFTIYYTEEPKSERQRAKCSILRQICLKKSDSCMVLNILIPSAMAKKRKMRKLGLEYG